MADTVERAGVAAIVAGRSAEPAHARLAETSPAYPSPGIAWSAVAVLMVLICLSLLDRQIISLMVQPIRREFGVSDSQIGLLQGLAFALLNGVAGVGLGQAIDRASRRWVIFAGVTIWSVAATLCGLARSFPELLAARAFVGIGEAALAPAAFSILSDLFPPRRLTFALSVFATGALLGVSGGLVTGGLILSLAAHGLDLPLLGPTPAWRAAFIVTGAPGVALSFLIFLIPEPPRRSLKGAGAAWADLFRFVASRWRFFACHTLGFGIVITLACANLAWAPTFLMRRFGFAPAKVGLTFGVFTLASGFVAFLITGRLVDRLIARGVSDAHFRLYAVCCAALAVIGALAFQAPSPWGYFGLMLLAAAPLNMSAVAASSVQLVTPSALRGRVSSLYLLIAGAGGLIAGPSIVAGFTDLLFHDDAKVGASLSLTFLLLAPVAAGAFVLGLKPMREARRLAPT